MCIPLKKGSFLLVTMCYLDIHPANILLAFFRLHPEKKADAFLSQHFPLPSGKLFPRVAELEVNWVLAAGTLARSSRPQELFRNWRSGPPVIPRTGSVRAHARKTHARHCTLLLTWNKHQEDGFPWPHAQSRASHLPQAHKTLPVVKIHFCTQETFIVILHFCRTVLETAVYMCPWARW